MARNIFYNLKTYLPGLKIFHKLLYKFQQHHLALDFLVSVFRKENQQDFIIIISLVWKEKSYITMKKVTFETERSHFLTLRLEGL